MKTNAIQCSLYLLYLCDFIWSEKRIHFFFARDIGSKIMFKYKCKIKK